MRRRRQMLPDNLPVACVVLCLVVCLCAPARAGVLRAQGVEISARETNFTIFFTLTADQEVAGLCVVLDVDPNLFTVRDFAPPAEHTPEWYTTVLSEAWAAFAWIMDFSPPYEGQTLPPGADLPVGGFLCELDPGTAPGTYPLHLPPEGRTRHEGTAAVLLRNSYVPKDGLDDVFPELRDGALQVAWPELVLSEVLTEFEGPRMTITVRGEGFIPQTVVLIGGERVPFVLLGSDRITIRGYECRAEATSALTVCNGPNCRETSFTCGTAFVRGDPNADGGIDIADPILLLGYLFSGEAVSCLDSADANDDGDVDIADPVGLLAFLFSGAPPPPQPYPDPGLDPTDDPLGCEAYGAQ